MRQTPIPGSLVWLRRRRWRVERTSLDRDTVRLDVSHREQRLTVLAPYDTPALLKADRRLVRVRRQQGLARLAHLIGSAPSARVPAAVVTSQIDIWPHQLEPLLAARGGQRRILIADEVGLGKTIQAGLILTDLLQRNPAARALVLAPASLRRQWSDELRDRFAIQACPADVAFEDVFQRHHRRAWQGPGVWLASVDYLKQPHVFEGLPPVTWDLVVIDEAHQATGRSDRHELCDELGRRTRRLVLLSATPHDGDATRFARLLRLGTLPYATDTLRIYRRTRTEVRLAHGRVARWWKVRTTPDLTRVLDALRTFEMVLLGRVKPGRHDTALLLLSVLRKRALSTMEALERSLTRRLEWLDVTTFDTQLDWLQPAFHFGADDLDDEERAALAADIGVPRALERTWLRRLRTLAAAVRRDEPKLAWLRGVARRTSEPFVVFTEFRHSIEALERTIGGIRTLAVVHGGLPDRHRQRELDRFLTGDASVLIASDVCSQGLNLQTRARWVIHLELPWNPARLEQRIGRLDRLGQQRRVHATLLVSDHAAERGLLASLARRTLTARGVVGRGTLDDLAPPPHLVVAAALIEGAPLPATAAAAPAAGIAPCVEYRRTARAMARVVAARRALRHRWRAPRGANGRPAIAPACAGILSDAARVVVIAVPLVDGTGEVVERRLVAGTMGPGAGDAAGETVCATLAALSERSVRARVRRIRRLRGTAARHQVAAERALAFHLHALRYPEEAQLGLFSQRQGRAFAMARAEAALGATETAARMKLEADQCVVDAGPASLEWIGTRR